MLSINGMTTITITHKLHQRSQGLDEACLKAEGNHQGAASKKCLMGMFYIQLPHKIELAYRYYLDLL